MVFALTALLLVALPAGSAFGLMMQTFVNPDGKTGQMSVSTSPPDYINWEACAAKLAKLTECRPWAHGPRTETLSAPAGTVFRARNAAGAVALSPEWRGPLKALAPPRVAGVIQANDYVSPAPGQWAGGWREEPAEMQLSACETEAGEGCVAITDPAYISRCPRSSSFYLDPQFAGRYLRVADRQNGGRHLEPVSGAITPYGAEVFPPARNTSVAIVGKIGPAVSGPVAGCGPPPAATATISPEGVARVECGGGCSVVLAGSRKGRRSFISRQIPEQNLLRPEAALEMRLPRSMLAGLGAGKVRLAVEIGGTHLAQRTIRMPRS